MAAEPIERLNNSTSAWVRLAQLGLRQHRQVTTEQLRQVGWESDDIVYRVRHGQLHAVFTGVFSLGGPPRTERERWMASVLTFGSGTRLSDSSAAELFGWLRYPLRELHVTTTTERAQRDGIKPHHRTRSTSWGHIDHIPVTGPEQTILDCAATIRSDKLFRRIVRQAQAEKTTSHTKLLLLTAQSAGVRGVARLRAELAHGPSPTRSAKEDDILDLLRSNPVILPNHDIDGDEVDLYLPEHGVVIEIDSPLHENPTSEADDAAKQDRVEGKGLRVYRLR
jgi:predicted transcriptional regulator of viral defense system